MAISLETSVESQKKYHEEPTIPEKLDEKSQFKNEILILVSAPLLTADLSLVETLSVQKEIDEIVSSLERLPNQLAVEITVEIATTQTLLQVLNRQIKPLIIHFIGHGMPTEEGIALLLEDQIGIGRPLTADELRKLVPTQTTAPCHLALLNACHSQGLASELIDFGVSHVIAVNAEDTILDIAARAFSKHLYQALFNNHTVSDAFVQSRRAVMLNDDLAKEFNPKTFKQEVNLQEAYKFHLLPENSLEHNQPLIFQSLASGQIIAPRWENNNIPSDDPTFIGRRRDLHHIAKDFESKRCIALHGMGGMGKTALALAAGRWQHERHRFRDGVWLIKLRDVDSSAKVITEISETLSLDREVVSIKTLASSLTTKNLLLILDDLDECLEKDRKRLTDLLNALISFGNLKLLTTSRRNIPAQEVFHSSWEVQKIGSAETMQAFRNYAPSEAQWDLEDKSQHDFQALMEFLDGYPFAIRLAAAYMRERRCSLKMLCEGLQNNPCNTLKPLNERGDRDNSLVATLDISYKALPFGAKELFPVLALFPGGMTKELATFVMGESSIDALAALLQFSMAEKLSSDWRVTLPEPARRYAESKQQNNIEDFAPKVLDYFYDFAKEIHNFLTQEEESQQGKQRVQDEQSNLNKFLKWGYEYEKRTDGICRSARITALLGKYWKWVIPGDDPMFSLSKALEAAKRNEDISGQEDIEKTIRDIQLLSQQEDTFRFQTITVNREGKIIRQETRSAKYLIETLPNNLFLEIVAIPGGIFFMGSPKTEEKRYENESQQEVTVYPFFMSKYPITQAQWRVVAALPKVNRELKSDPSNFKGDDRPVEQISWYEAVEFCDRLSHYTGKNYRLPSEAEWEYACRAGTTTPFHFGETITEELANYDASIKQPDGSVTGEYRKQTTPVASFKVINAFGLYDMHGNVWEWCADKWYGSYQGALNDGSDRIESNSGKNSPLVRMRGGSWKYYPQDCRSASRECVNPDIESDDFGFRVVVSDEST